MNINYLLVFALIGIICGILGVHYYNKEQVVAEEPISTSYNPYQSGIYAKCTIEAATTEPNNPPSPYLFARCFVNEILVPDLPLSSSMLEGILFLRGGNFEGLPIEFVKIEPAIISDPDTSMNAKVLPVIFRFQKPSNYNIFPGQSVDVYIKGK